ncbi:MAG: adenine deaminase [Nitrospirae bacterium]|nr:adenine deaminase [Nitrospirota bacterium]
MVHTSFDSSMSGLQRRIEVARGIRPADLLIRGGRVVNVLTGEIYRANIAISDNVIAGVGDYYSDGTDILEAGDQYLLPGFIDAHVHVESSMLSVPEYARAVLPRGTTSVICDPHEIANVSGLEGIKYLIRSGVTVPLNLFVMASSCVPATQFETSGAVLSPNDIEEMLQWEGVIGLAEVMNVPDVLSGSDMSLRKLLCAQRRGYPVDGHSPFLTGKDLNAYIGAGVRSDHEVTSREEAIEKLRLGMYLMIREGSVARNMEDLLPVVNTSTYRRCMFVTDDAHPGDLLKRGHMDHILRKAVSLGMDPVMAISMVTINPARVFLRNDLGAIMPGYRADIVAVNSIRDFSVRDVVKEGKIVVRDCKVVCSIENIEDDSMKDIIKIKDLSPERFKVKITGRKIRVIELIRRQIYTRHIIEEVEAGEDREIKADPSRDMLKIAVVERHHATGNIGIGFVRGFGLREGAIASSVSHDSHNVIVVGTNDLDMYEAVKEIIRLGGGHVITSGGEVMGSLPLPIAGLLSDKPLEDVVQEEERLLAIARSLGVKPLSPFIKLSFLALSVIPELKITDKGLVDVKKFGIVGIEP